MASRVRKPILIALGVIAVVVAAWSITRAGGPAVPECAGGQSLEFNCFAERYAAMTRASGPDAALKDLAARRAASGYLVSACHQLTHVIGRTAGELHGEAAFAQGSDVCSSGYYHGIVESVMTALGPARIVEQAHVVCATHRRQDSRSYLLYNCVHGMGHGFMAVFGTDVFLSLAGCDGLADSWERHHCYAGVVMENLTAITNPVRPSTSLRPDAPLYPCTAVHARYKAECYVKQTAYALHVSRDDFAATFRICRRDADAEFRAACYQGLGADASIKSSKHVIGDAARAATTGALCLQGSDGEARAHCIAGAVTTSVRDRGGDDGPARRLCAALADRELAAACEAARLVASHGVPTPEAAHTH
jgi:hypothetical protein